MGFPTRYRAETLQWKKADFARFTPLSLRAKCFASSPKSVLTKYESLMHAGPNRVASSLFRVGRFLRTPTCLVVSLLELTVLVFALNPDSLMMSDACLKSGSVPKCCQV